MKVDCPYCQGPAKLVKGSDIYYGRREYADRIFWACLPCKAWVGVHARSIDYQPLGKLANHELRVMRMRTHEAFDPIWLKKKNKALPLRKARTEGYTWLAEKLGIHVDHCHIAQFNLEQCFNAIRICKEEAAKDDIACDVSIKGRFAQCRDP